MDRREIINQERHDLWRLIRLYGTTTLIDLTNTTATADKILAGYGASIGNYAFANCYALQSITIPSGVTSILNGAFQYCYGIEEYHITPTTPPTLSNTNVFSGIVSGTIIYVPSESLEAYQTAENWSTYASYMQGE